MQSVQAYQLLRLPQDDFQGNQTPNHLLDSSQESHAPNPSPTHSSWLQRLRFPWRSRSKAQETAVKEWMSWKLKWPWILTILLFNISLLISIIYLQQRSIAHNGIVTVPQNSEPLITIPIVYYKISHYSLLWTTIPTLVINIFSFMWATIVAATAFRQPFVELHPSPGKVASARNTILLDYRSYSELNIWWKAFRRDHIGLGIAMLLASILKFVVGPLMASLFVSASSQSTSSISISYTNAFNDSIFDPRTSLQPFIDFGSSILAYQAQPPSWMTEQYAFAAFQPVSFVSSGNITANTTAYSAVLDCQAFSPEESNAQYSVDSYGDPAVNYNMTDRGCPISSFQSIINTTLTYSASWNQQTCPKSQYGRIGIFAGLYDDASPIKIANYTLISCIPEYFLTNGSLTVSVSSRTPGSPKFVAFNQTQNTTVHPSVWTNTIEGYLHNYMIFDPSNTITGDQFGYAVLQYAQSQNRSSPLTPDLYKSSMSQLYSTLFVGFASSALLQDVSTSQTATGSLSIPVQRLYVVSPIAWAIVAVLACTLLCNVYLWVYAATKHSDLVEEPKGLLGNAALVVEGGVSELVKDFRRKHPDDWKVEKDIKDYYTVDNSRCYFDASQRKIVVQGLIDRRAEARE